MREIMEKINDAKRFITTRSDNTFEVIEIKELKQILANYRNGYMDDYNRLNKDYTLILEENDRLEYEKRFSAVQTKKYIEIIDSLTEKIDKLESQEYHDACKGCKHKYRSATEYPCDTCNQNFMDNFERENNDILNPKAKKKAKKSENISRTPEQAEVLSNEFWELSADHIKTLMELQKVKYQCKDWELEAKKAAAKLGEIRILMDGGKRDNKVVWKGEIEKSPYCPKCNYPLTLDGEPNYCTECGVMINWEVDK